MSVQFAVTAAETPAAKGHGETHSTEGFRALMLGSIGVVFARDHRSHQGVGTEQVGLP